jgi:hypothetical protein
MTPLEPLNSHGTILLAQHIRWKGGGPRSLVDSSSKLSFTYVITFFLRLGLSSSVHVHLLTLYSSLILFEDLLKSESFLLFSSED